MAHDAEATATYEGKAKIVRPLADAQVAVYFKDTATAFNGQKRQEIAGKGQLNAAISALCFAYLQRAGVPNHFIAQTDARTLRCRRATMIPLEVVVRFATAGSLLKRTGLPAGTACTPPVIEFYYKRDDLGDPLLNADHIHLLRLATADEIDGLAAAGLRAAQLLQQLFGAADLRLVDIKLEYGRCADGLLLADEISPDICRLHDASSGNSLDKDLFRQDTGDLLSGYREVLQRLAAQTADV